MYRRFYTFQKYIYPPNYEILLSALSVVRTAIVCT